MGSTGGDWRSVLGTSRSGVGLEVWGCIVSKHPACPRGNLPGGGGKASGVPSGLRRDTAGERRCQGSVCQGEAEGEERNGEVGKADPEIGI